MPRSAPSATPWTTRSWNQDGVDQAAQALTRPRQRRTLTAEWLDWFNDQRLHTSIGDIPPHEHETNHYAQHQPQPAAGVSA
ncbi:integrase core domain-containing protein [Streptomyces pseudogriseolus]|uniref:integrase core domain-containing protein n=1 Tax=Streptomyces pseudogriseolus TaxID=36817 RepID=UPI003FA33356